MIKIKIETLDPELLQQYVENRSDKSLTLLTQTFVELLRKQENGILNLNRVSVITIKNTSNSQLK